MTLPAENRSDAAVAAGGPQAAERMSPPGQSPHAGKLPSARPGASYVSDIRPPHPDGYGSPGSSHPQAAPVDDRQTTTISSTSTVTDFWLTAECLGGESDPTVIADACGPHRFHRLFRTFQANRSTLPPQVAEQGLALVQRAVREGRAVTTPLRTGNLRLQMNCRPLFGPSGAVHAVQMNAGVPDGPSRQIPLIPVEFGTDRLARFASPDHQVPALFDSDTPWTLPALLEHVVWLDKRLDLIALFDPIEPASRWCESLVVVDPVTQMRHHLWMAARSVTDPHGAPIVRAVIADLTDLVAAPGQDPLIDHLATRTPRGHGSALMDLRTTLMHSFVCRADPRLAGWRHGNPQLHPEDMPAVLQAVVDVTGGRPATMSARMRFTDTEPWTTLHGTWSPLPNYTRPQASIDFWIED